MNCRTCSQEMRPLVVGPEGDGIWRCLRCGTATSQQDGEQRWHVPELVKKCREFARDSLGVGHNEHRYGYIPQIKEMLEADWARLGIAECIEPKTDGRAGHERAAPDAGRPSVPNQGEQK